jgi:hypothetical protein
LRERVESETMIGVDRCAFVVMLIGCGPTVDPLGGSEGGTTQVDGSSTSTGSSSSTTMIDETTTSATSIEATAEATTLPATSLLPPESSSSSSESTGAPPLDDCTLPPGETAAVSGDGIDLRYAVFGWTGGGKCPSGWRIVFVESRDVLEQNLDGLPGATGIVPRVEVFVEASVADEPLAAGEYAADVEVVVNAGDRIYGSGIVVTDGGAVEEVGAVFEGTVTIAIDDPPIELMGTFAAPVCTDVDFGACGA